MTDEEYIKSALKLAKKGSGYVSPNPMVGCVIVKNGKIIGKGYHRKYGENHAEINAINSAETNIKNSTVYVTLEPCSIYGNTPPCTERLIKEKIKNLKDKQFVVKDQIHAGGRGKAGGIKLVNEVKKLEKEINLMFGKILKSHQTGP